MKKKKKKRSLSQKYIFGVKAIADYLNVSERNVYLWEQDLDFPLHRIGDSNKRTVYASVDEIEKWLRKRPSSHSTKKRKNKIILSGSVILAAAVVIVLVWIFFLSKNNQYDFYISPLPNPKTAFIQDKNVHIRDESGKVIWSYIESDVPIGAEENEAAANLDFFDIDGDQANEVIAKEYEHETNRFYLTLFDNDGSRIWQRSIINDQSFRGFLLRSSFYPICSKFAHIKEKTFILTAWRHRTRFLVIIVRYDLNGNLLNEYIHTGHVSFLFPLDLNQDGIDEILFGATNNLLNGEAVLGVLPIKNFKGVCPPNRIESEYQHLQYLLQKYIADEMEVGNQLVYIRFKRANPFEELSKTYIFAVFDHSDNNLFHIYIFPWDIEYEDNYIGFEYVFSNQLELMDIIPSSNLRRVYSQLCKKGGEDISLQKLTNIYAENVFAWEQEKWVPLKDLSFDLDH
jgi:hypothetical protein